MKNAPVRRETASERVARVQMYLPLIRPERILRNRTVNIPVELALKSWDTNSYR